MIRWVVVVYCGDDDGLPLLCAAVAFGRHGAILLTTAGSRSQAENDQNDPFFGQKATVVGYL